MNKIDFLDLFAINQRQHKELVSAFSRVLDSGWYIMGEELEQFEKEFAEYCGVKYCIGVANGLDALILVLRAWKELGYLEDGDEVLVPANTYIASILAITENKLVPVLVEPDIETYNIIPGSLPHPLSASGKRWATGVQRLWHPYKFGISGRAGRWQGPTPRHADRHRFRQ